MKMFISYLQFLGIYEMAVAFIWSPVFIFSVVRRREPAAAIRRPSPATASTGHCDRGRKPRVDRSPRTH